MRQVWISVPQGEGKRIQELARQHHGSNLIMLQAENQEQRLEVVVFSISNNAVSKILENLNGVRNARVTLFPQDVFPLPQPQTNVPDQITQVTHRSPVEVWLNGLKSIGSWKGFLGYAVAASFLVWIGMFTNTAYLLIGAMLVAPFAGPAMNFALATASGDSHLLQQNLLRYFVSLLLTMLVAGVLSLVFQQQVATNIMVSVSELSFISVLLPLTAGAVGAHSLSQSENTSLVPGSAVGALVAASLAPPAGLVGMSLAIGRWDMAINGAFLLIMQLCAINLSGSFIFHLYGQKPGNVILRDSQEKVRWGSLIVSGTILAVMLAVQFASSPDFQRSSRAQRATSVAQQVIRSDPRVNLVETNLRFTRPSIEGQDTLLGTVFVEREPEVQQPAQQIAQELARDIQQQLLLEGYQVNPLISVTVLDPPGR